MKKLGSHTHAGITKRLNQLDELRNSLIEALNINIQNNMFWPIISRQQLTIFTDNPILATQIKYQQKKICTHLFNAYKINLEAVHTKLISSKIASKPINIQAKPLKKSTSQTLSSIADGIDDSELKQILKNISNREVK